MNEIVQLPPEIIAKLRQLLFPKKAVYALNPNDFMFYLASTSLHYLHMHRHDVASETDTGTEDNPNSFYKLYFDSPKASKPRTIKFTHNVGGQAIDFYTLNVRPKHDHPLELIIHFDVWQKWLLEESAQQMTPIGYLKRGTVKTGLTRDQYITDHAKAFQQLPAEVKAYPHFNFQHDDPTKRKQVQLGSAFGGISRWIKDDDCGSPTDNFIIDAAINGYQRKIGLGIGLCILTVLMYVMWGLMPQNLLIHGLVTFFAVPLCLFFGIYIGKYLYSGRFRSWFTRTPIPLAQQDLSYDTDYSTEVNNTIWRQLKQNPGMFIKRFFVYTPLLAFGSLCVTSLIFSLGFHTTLQLSGPLAFAAPLAALLSTPSVAAVGLLFSAFVFLLYFFVLEPNIIQNKRDLKGRGTQVTFTKKAHTDDDHAQAHGTSPDQAPGHVAQPVGVAVTKDDDHSQVHGTSPDQAPGHVAQPVGVAVEDRKPGTPSPPPYRSPGTQTNGPRPMSVEPPPAAPQPIKGAVPARAMLVGLFGERDNSVSTMTPPRDQRSAARSNPAHPTPPDYLTDGSTHACPPDAYDRGSPSPAHSSSDEASAPGAAACGDDDQGVLPGMPFTDAPKGGFNLMLGPTAEKGALPPCKRPKAPTPAGGTSTLGMLAPQKRRKTINCDRDLRRTVSDGNERWATTGSPAASAASAAAASEPPSDYSPTDSGRSSDVRYLRSSSLT